MKCKKLRKKEEEVRYCLSENTRYVRTKDNNLLVHTS